MAMSPEALAEFEKKIVKARQKDLPFGLCLGKKPEDNVLVLDLKKSPDVLMRAAKQDGETGKVTCGTLGVKGKIMSLTLEHKMLPGLARNMKTFLTKNKIKMKVVILDPDGNELESDGDDAVDAQDADVSMEAETETGSAAAAPDAGGAAHPPAGAEPVGDNPPPPPPPPPSGNEAAAAKWLKLSTELDPQVKAFSESGHPKAPAIAKAWEGGQAAADQGNYKVAFAVADKIRPVVAPAQTATAPQSPPDATAAEPTMAASTDPEALKWAQTEARIGALYLDVMNLNPPDASKLRTVWMAATESAGLNDFKKAGAIAARLEPMLLAAKAAGASDQQQVVPPDVVPFQKSKLAWEAARTKMKAEVASLVEAIKAACAGDEELKEIADNAGDLHRHLDAMDDHLDDALNAVINAPAGPQRERARQDAVQAIATLQAVLGQPFFQDVDSKNGFKPVKVTETAMRSLAAISKIISAQVKSAA